MCGCVRACAAATLLACCCDVGGQPQRTIKLIALLAQTEIAEMHGTRTGGDEDDTFAMRSGTTSHADIPLGTDSRA